MPVEIRELNIRGSVKFGNQIDKRFEQVNSPLFQTQFVEQLKRDIISECTDLILDKLERQKSR